MLNEYFKQFYPANLADCETEFTTMLGGMQRVKSADNIFPQIVCQDGVHLSVQGHYGAYSTPRDDFADDYSRVEVGYIKDANNEKMAPPESWREFADGEFPSDIYGYVPVAVVEQFIADHGGIKAAP